MTMCATFHLFKSILLHLKNLYQMLVFPILCRMSGVLGQEVLLPTLSFAIFITEEKEWRQYNALLLLKLLVIVAYI